MKNSNSGADAASLRHRAEKFLRKKPLKNKLHDTESDLLKLIYKLEVHQVELELQNEELSKAKIAAQEAADKYMELYDFAPIGYIELSNEGSILEINLFASQILGNDRAELKNSQFGFFICDETKPVFNHFLLNVFNSHNREICEVTLTSSYKSPLYASLTGIISSNKERCLVTVMDITDQKRAEAELEKWATIFKPKAN